MSDDLVKRLRRASVQKLPLNDYFKAAADRIEELEAKLDEAVDTAEDYKHCLHSWFDTKHLAQAEIDPKIIQSASGYLRTSRSGGMSDDESDLVLSVIEDMAHLGVFSTIFTQFTLAELRGQNDE